MSAGENTQNVEERLAELESLLRRRDSQSVDRKTLFSDHGGPDSMRRQSHPCSSPGPRDGANGSNQDQADSRRRTGELTGWAATTVVEILKDLSVEASGCFIGASSQISLGRMISAMVEPRDDDSGSVSGDAWEHLSPKSANTAAGASEQGLRNPSPETAARLFNAYIRHISTRWPVIQTPFLRLLHAERDTLTDPFL